MSRPSHSTARVAICADVGSTFTKVAVVDLDTATVVASASHRTTVDSDVLHGLDAAVAQAVRSLPHPPGDLPVPRVCSSAGGGLRLAVVGYEPLVTAEAGHRVGLCAGAKVVHVAAGNLDRAGLSALRAAQADVILLVGGTDGGNSAVLAHNAARLAAARLATHRRRVPVVVAGNAAARDEVVATLCAGATPVVAAGNVLPRIGELNPQPARAAIREVFLRHVIGGKHLSRGPRFASLVRGATPDVVLSAVELLAEHLPGGGDLVVVDVGGATTDVYSVLSPDPDEPVPARDVAGTLWHSRTVEGDLGMRCSAPGVVEAALRERLLDRAGADQLTLAAAVRAADPAFLAASAPERGAEERLATLAATIALRRHARGEHRDRSTTGGVGWDIGAAGPHAYAVPKDLRRVSVVVGSGGVLRHAAPGRAEAVMRAIVTDPEGGWSVPRAAQVCIDMDYVLAPAGLLATDHPDVAVSLLHNHLR